MLTGVFVVGVTFSSVTSHSEGLLLQSCLSTATFAFSKDDFLLLDYFPKTIKAYISRNFWPIYGSCRRFELLGLKATLDNLRLNHK